MNHPQNESWKFFGLVFLFSWGFWLLPILFGTRLIILQVLGGLGIIIPSSLGIILAYLKGDKANWNDFRHRIYNFRQIKPGWYLIILLLIPVSTGIALIINYLVTGILPKLDVLNHYLANPLQLIMFSLFTLLFGPLAEEIGWRGFALDHLEKQYNWLVSSLILGTFWALWHIPAFFIKDTYQYRLLMDSPLYMLDFIIAFFPVSIIMDWIYNNNRRSILSGILFHFSINFFGEIINIPNHIKPYRTLIQLVIAVFILISWCDKTTLKNLKPTVND